MQTAAELTWHILTATYIQSTLMIMAMFPGDLLLLLLPWLLPHGSPESYAASAATVHVAFQKPHVQRIP